MAEPKYHRLREYLPDQGNSTQQDYPPPYIDNQPVSSVPTRATIRREVHEQPDDYLGLSVFVLICCCLPAGLVAVVKSCEVEERFRAGDYSGALESSRSAKAWARGGFIYGTLTWVLVAVFVVIYMVFLHAAVNEAVNENTYGNTNGFHYPSQNMK